MDKETITNLDARVTGLERDVSNLVNTVSNFTQEIRATINNIQNQGKPQWGTIVAGIGVLTVLVTAIGSAALAPLYVSDSYHGQRTSRITTQIDELDDVLQREMRTLDDIQKARMDAMDVTLQREMRMLLDVSEAKRESLEERLKDTEEETKTLAKEFEAHRDRIGHPAMVERVQAIIDNLEHTRSNRWTNEQQRDYAASVQHQIDEIRDEQNRRTNKVYEQ